jgi:hypothetical protein
MSVQSRKPERSRTSITERLANVLARAKELEAVSAWDLHGRLRMTEIVRVNRARMDFEHFRNVLDSELSNLDKLLNDALSIVMEAPESNVPALGRSGGRRADNGHFCIGSGLIDERNFRTARPVSGRGSRPAALIAWSFLRPMRASFVRHR